MELAHEEETSHSLRRLYLFSGGICFLFLLYSLSTMLIMLLIGTPPKTIEECFAMLKENRFFGFLRLDILTVFIMPFYYILFYAIKRSVIKPDRELSNISTLLVFIGLTLFLATPSVFSFVKLSDMYHLTDDIAEKERLLAAGNAIYASDMWHGTGALVGGLLQQCGAVLVSIVMMKSKVFTKTLSVIGIITHGLDFLHILMGFFSPVIGAMILAIGGTLYLIWFPMLGIQLIGLSKRTLS